MKIIYNDKILDRVSLFMKVGGITLYPFIILRERYRDSINSDVIINHESIHIEQQKEMLVIPFYIIYILEFIIKLFKYKGANKAYRALSFEREAYGNEYDADYLNKRKRYSFFKYL